MRAEMLMIVLIFLLQGGGGGIIPAAARGGTTTTTLETAWDLKALAEEVVEISRQEMLEQMREADDGAGCTAVDQCEDALPNPQTSTFFYANPVSFDADTINFAGTDPIRNVNDGSVVLPDNLRQRVCATSTLTPAVWQPLLEEFGESILWQFYGDQETGYMRTYPGTDSRGNCADFDPRLRAWYANAATGPRDVIYIIDKSGSMLDANRWNIAKAAVRASIDTLTYVDYAAIVAFSSGGSGTAASGETMEAMTADGRSRLKAWLDSQAPNGGTNFEAGFETAFNVVANSRAQAKISGCHQMLMFFTDGEMTEGANPSKLIRKVNGPDTENDFRIFSYSVGANADHEVPKALACENKGVWYAIPDGADISAQVARTYLYFAGKYASQGKFRWSEAYEDGLGLGQVRTVCLPIYDFLTELAGDIHGAICSDIDEDAFQALPQAAAAAARMRQDSKECSSLDYTYTELEALRARSNTDICGAKYDPNPSKGGGGGETLSDGAIIGIAFSVLFVLCIAPSIHKKWKKRMANVAPQVPQASQAPHAPQGAHWQPQQPTAPPSSAQAMSPPAYDNRW